MRTKSCFKSLRSMPAAQKMEDSRGTRISGMERASAIMQAWLGPAPPAVTSGKSRGSYPAFTAISRTAAAMPTLMTSYMPAAASMTLKPMGAAIFSSTALVAFSSDSFMRPPAKKSGSR